MKITWITARKLNRDLASSTEIGLGNALDYLGNEITIISPSSKLKSINIKHLEIKYWRFIGMETFSGSRYLKKKKIISKKKLNYPEVILVDWRYVPSIYPILNNMGIPWIIVDRGPPAYKGFRTMIQKILWKIAWKKSIKYSKGGFVVSEFHKNMIDANNDNIRILMAGATKNKENINNNITDGIWKFIYIGELEKTRGLDDIFLLSEHLKKRNIEHIIDVYGDGKYYNKLVSKADKNNNIRILGRVKHEGINKIMLKYNFGLMLMPDDKIWQISSPLKLAEYLNSGLIIVGPKHVGNELLGGEEWSLLSESSNWVEGSIDKIENIIINNKVEYLADLAFESSKTLHWESIAKQMNEDIKYMIK